MIPTTTPQVTATASTIAVTDPTIAAAASTITATTATADPNYLNDPCYLCTVDNPDIFEIGEKTLAKIEKSAHYAGVVDYIHLNRGFFIMLSLLSGTLIVKNVDRHYKVIITYMFRILATNYDTKSIFKKVTL